MNNTAILTNSNYSRTIPLITKREKDVLILIANGLPTHRIAKQLYISVETVKTHRKNLLRKLNACNGASLIRAAFLIGLF